MPSDRYLVETIPLTQDLRDCAANEWKAASGQTPSTAAASAFALGLGALVCAVVWPAYHSTTMIAATAALILGLVLVILFRARRAARRLSARVARLCASPRCIRHSLNLDGAHQLIFHDGGLLVLAPLGPKETFFHDFNSDTDEPLYTPVKHAYQEGGLLSRWTWCTLEDGGRPFAFAMAGEPFIPSVRDHFAYAEEEEEFAQLFGNEWMPRDDIAKIDFNTLLKRDENLRARYA